MRRPRFDTYRLPDSEVWAVTAPIYVGPALADLGLGERQADRVAGALEAAYDLGRAQEHKLLRLVLGSADPRLDWDALDRPVAFEAERLRGGRWGIRRPGASGHWLDRSGLDEAQAHRVAAEMAAAYRRGREDRAAEVRRVLRLG